MTQQLGIFGYPLAHSVSPAFQQAALDHYSLPVRYHAWPTPPERLADEVGRLRGDEYLGANVTIPHKERVLSLLDGVDDLSSVIGAVNTIAREEGGRLMGHNTDVYGFLTALREQAAFEPQGSSALLLGAGGAARAVAFALAKERVASLTIANRTLDRANRLADEVRTSIASVAAVPLTGADLGAVTRGVDLIVNATSVGMGHGPEQGQTPLRAELIPAGALVYDLVYTPSDTPFLLEARKAGARTLGGLSMLVYQGAASFELWTGREAPIEVMFQAAEKALEAS